LAAVALSQTPTGELTALPRTSKLGLTGLLLRPLLLRGEEGMGAEEREKVGRQNDLCP